MRRSLLAITAVAASLAAPALSQNAGVKPPETSKTGPPNSGATTGDSPKPAIGLRQDPMDGVGATGFSTGTSGSSAETGSYETRNNANRDKQGSKSAN